MREELILTGEFRERARIIGEIGIKVKNDPVRLIGIVRFSRYISERYDYFLFKFFHVADERDDEIHRKENSIFTYRMNEVEATADKERRVIQLWRDIKITPSGLGIGTYLASNLFDRLKELYPDYRVEIGTLSSVDASELNRATRDAFYRKIGFTLSVKEDGGGSLGTGLMSQLKTGWNKDKIEEIPLSSFLIKAVDELNSETWDHILRLNAKDKEIEELENRRRGFF